MGDSVMQACVQEGLLDRLNPLRERILAGNNDHCFIERQELLSQIDREIECIHPAMRYAFAFESLLANLSTPIDPQDVFAGKMLEGPWDSEVELQVHVPYLQSPGHTTLDWEDLLKNGLRSKVVHAHVGSEKQNTLEARNFAENAERCCNAVIAFAERYARAARTAARNADGAERSHLLRIAAALDQAPAGPAPDFFTALQAIWLIQLVTSCVVGARDFAYGRLDQFLLPLYKQGLREGSLDEDTARTYIAHLFIKTKEITGTATDNYKIKPTPSHASNQYVVIGGVTPSGEDAINDLSYLILEAVCLAGVPQPEINVRIDAGSPKAFKEAVAQAVEVCAHQIQFWNDRVILNILSERYPGVKPEDARDYAFTACNRINFPGKENITGGEYWHVMPRWLLAALNQGQDPCTGELLASDVQPLEDIASLEHLLDNLARIARAQVTETVGAAAERSRQNDPAAFHFESVLLRDCLDRSRDARGGGVRYPTQFHLFAGIATVGDSLMAIDKLVFEDRRYSLAELMAIVRNNFVDHEVLRQEILNRIPRYGSGQEASDNLARRVSEIAFDTLNTVDNPDGNLLFPALYSLHHHINWGREMPATPDGRLAGDPLSENQSPTQGADNQGISGLFKSVARLPHQRAVMGGLNVKFGGKMPREHFIAMLDVFFEMGCVQVGYTCVDRSMLLAAQSKPNQHRNLCVRITGFSEYFVSLSPEAQQDLIERTEYV